MYAQLDFIAGAAVKRVNLIGGEEVGIIPALIDAFPGEFVNLAGRENKPLDCFDWWYLPALDRFVKTADVPQETDNGIPSTQTEGEGVDNG